MRVLEADLDTALDNNAEPYLQLQYCVDDGFVWLDAPYPMYSYKLGGLELVVQTSGTAIFDAYAIRLKRGAYSHLTAHSVTSSRYYVNDILVTQKEHIEIQATIIPKGTTTKYSVNGNQSYLQIITAICTEFGYTVSFEDPAAAFWDNIFYPAGRTLVLQSPHAIFTLLRQKLFIYAQDNNDDDLYFRQWLDDQVVGTVGHPSLETVTTFDWKTQYSLQYRMLMWRDEASTIHYWPDPAFFPDLPIYNLGYLESTADEPDQWQSWHRNEDKRAFHLKYQDGDILHCDSGTYQVQVFEVFDCVRNVFDRKNPPPTLHLQFVALPKFSTTEGGPLPSTILAAAPYTPLNVSNFSGILDENDNNIQAAMDTIDDHSHAGMGDVVGPAGATADHLAVFDGATGKIIKDGGHVPTGDVVGPAGATADHLAVFDGATGKLIKDGGAVPAGGGNVVGPPHATVTSNFVTWHDTTGLEIDDIGWKPADFATAAKGVTNGDTHDHNGGDGAQIAHSSLSGIGTHTHAEIDTHLGIDPWPVGAIYMSVVSTSPASLFGGTWAAFGQGKVLIGIDVGGDADFDTSEETGGGKTSTPDAHAGAAVGDHTFTQPNAHSDHTFTQPSQHAAKNTDVGADTSNHPSGTTGTHLAEATHAHNITAYTHSGGAVDAHSAHAGGAVDAHNVTQPSAHTAMSIVQPYIVVYMWKRTA